MLLIFHNRSPLKISKETGTSKINVERACVTRKVRFSSQKAGSVSITESWLPGQKEGGVKPRKLCKESKVSTSISEGYPRRLAG